MFKLRTPSPALLVAVVALFVALSGSAVAAGIVPLAKRAFVADNAKKLGGKTRAQLLAAARGARGPQGLPGAKGDTGLTGAAGPAGPQGAQGAQGAKGDQGDKGDKGDVGDGIHLTGTVATVGDLPATGSTGDAYLVGDHLYAWDGTQWVDGGEIHAGGASLVAVRTAPFTIDPGDSVLFTVSCAPGEKALSGGFTYPPSPALVMAADTLPTDDDSGWQLDIINFDDSTTVTGTLEVVCTR